MESLKNLAVKKTLSILSFLIFILWIVVCVALSGIFILIEINDSTSDIRCDAEFDKDERDLILEKCFDEYQKKYSKFPVYGFVFINCLIMAMVPIIYSLCLKSRVNELETLNQNVVGPLQQSRVLFTAYCSQLAATIVLATVFIIVLQIHGFRASTNFPSNFECNPLKQGSNSSAFSSSNGSRANTDIYPCRNTRANKKFGGSVALTVFNGIWAFFAFIELVWILSRARNGTQFMDDSRFYADHLSSNREQEKSKKAVPLSSQDSEEDSASSLPEQHPAFEPEQQTELQAELTPLMDCIIERTEQLKDLNQEQSKKAVPLSSQDSEEDSASSLPEQHPAFEPEQQTELQAELTPLMDCIIERTEQLKDLNQEQSKKAVPLSSQDSEEDSASSLPEQHPAFEPEQQTELQAELTRLKDCIIERTEQLKDLNQPIRSRHGEGPKPNDLKLDQIFVKLAIRNDVASYDLLGNRQEQLEVFSGLQSNQSEYVPWQDIFEGNNKHILLIGRPGIGKTILSTKLLRVSAFNELKYRNFDAAFLVKFRHYNSRGEDLNLRKLLSLSETVSKDLDDKVWNYITTNPTKVLLIFDGIDEFNARSKISNDDSGLKDSKEEEMPLHFLYKKIASGKVLKGATVITTSRPTASSCVRELKFDKVLEILGFTPREIEEYVKWFTKEHKNPEAEKEAIWKHISTNINLFTLCYVPVNCFIICSCLSRLRSLGKSLPTKLTKIYSVALKIFSFRHSDKYRMDEEAHDQLFLTPFHKLPTECKGEFQKLGKIAFTGIEQERLLFTSEEVQGLKDCGLFHRLPDLPSQDGLSEDKAQYCFIHLTFQEFLAAKHVVDTMTEAQELKQFISGHISEGPWQLVVQFVAGLLVDTDKAKQLQFCKMLVELLPMSTSEAKSQLGQQDAHLRMTEKPTAFVRWPHGESEKNLAVTICKCLYELDIKEQSLIKRKMEEISFDEVFLVRCSLEPNDCRAILHFLKNHDKKFTLCLHGNFMDDLCCFEFKNWIVESDFCRGSCNLEGLSFAYNNVSEKGVGYLCDALKSEKCSLTVLVLNHNDVGDKGAELLSGAIKDGNCKLTRLNLAYNKIGLKGVEHLKDALKYVNNNLTELNLALNDILDKGAEYLSDALKDVNCKLTLLDLSCSFIGDKGAEYLSDALKDVNCKLTLLDLRDNYVGDKGAEYLSDALKDVNGRLTFLDLRQNYVGGKGAEHLSDALKGVNRKLTVLNLAQNGVEDKGAEYLSDALKYFRQKLTVLKLALNDVRDKEAEYLSDALRDLHQKLTELNLAPIKTEAEYMSDALKDLLQKLTVGVKGVEYSRRIREVFGLELCVTQDYFGDKPAEHNYTLILKDLNHNLAVLKLALNDVGDK